MIELTSRGDIALLRLQHGKANTLDLELCQALTKELEAFRQSASKALVVTGSGRIFSAGVDLRRVVDEGASYVRAFLPAAAACRRSHSAGTRCSPARASRA